MVMYLKNQGGYKMNYFKGMKYKNIRAIFEKVWDQIQSFAPMDSEKEKGSEKKGSRKKSLARKRAGEKQSEESTKRQKIEDDTGHENEMAFELLRFIRSQVNHKFMGGLLGFRASTLSIASYTLDTRERPLNVSRQKERKAKSILLLAIPDEYQPRFHTIKDAKSLLAAIKSRFGGNVESKKMQKNVLKQQFENFSVSDTEEKA
ncbi:hypothetical protein Tco_0411558 [Tanacetum coccineum]